MFRMGNDAQRSKLMTEDQKNIYEIAHSGESAEQSISDEVPLAGAKTSRGITCVWQGCTAAADATHWTGLAPGWSFAMEIPPDDRDGCLCPLHGEAYEEWARFELYDNEPGHYRQ
jgi:hypothetical protein